MNLEKESKMLEQGIIVCLLFAVVILIVWAATVVTAGFVFAANKFLWK